MTDYLTEKEQIELLRNWIKEYSLYILAGFAMAGLVLFGWREWQQRAAKIQMHASSVYDEMLAMRSQNNSEATIVQAKKLVKHYPQTVYGELATFMLAKDAVAKNNYQAAEERLNWVIDHSRNMSFRQIARIRLARLQLALKKPDDSLKMLQKVDDPSFAGLINEVKGDAYLAMNNPNMARQSYQAALANLPNALEMRPLLQMKYDNLT